MYTLLIFIAILALLVLSHEFGHFISARRNGIKVEEFGFGFPPRLFGIQMFRGQQNTGNKKRRLVWGNKDIKEIAKENNGQEGTIYSINLIPIGGFVRIKGEDGSQAEDPDSFGSKKNWQKAVVLSAGVIMNVVLAIVLLSIGYMFGLPQVVDELPESGAVKDRRLEIAGVLPDKPAELAGIVAGDIILTLDNIENPRLKEMQAYVDEHKNDVLSVTILRGSEKISKEIKPIVYEDTGRGGLGVAIAEIGIVSYPWYLAIWHGFLTTFIYLKEIILAFGLLIKGLFTGVEVAGEMAGPVGIAVLTGKAARLGFAYLIQFTAVLSLNLAIINILPIPAMDGGRLLFLLIAKIRKKAVDLYVEQWIHALGFFALLFLVVIITVQDISTFRNVIAGFFAGLF